MYAEVLSMTVVVIERAVDSVCTPDRAMLPALDTEYAYWMTGGVNGSAVTIPMAGIDGTADVVVLNRYVSVMSQPRPEGYAEDWQTVRGMPLPVKNSRLCVSLAGT